MIKMFVWKGVFALFFFTLLSLDGSAQSVPKCLTLLDGYTLSKVDGRGVVETGLIKGPNGLSIDYEAGMSQGYAADPLSANKFEWFRKQTLPGKVVFLALEKSDRGDSSKDKASRRQLIVTIPLSQFEGHAINFRAEVSSDSHLADALLIILSFHAGRCTFD